MLEIVDTHSHIQSAGGKPNGERSTREIWAKDPTITGDTLLANAATEGVTRVIAVGCDLEDSQLAIDFVKKHENSWASIGLHPHEAARYAHEPELLEQFAALASEEKVVAIGECGLDYFYTHSPAEEQRAILKFQLELAQKHNVPMIFHVREALDEFWPIFDSYPGIRGVLHSFTDTKAHVEEAVKRGLYIGVNGIATFAKQDAQLDMYKAIPLENLLIETDAPFLTPTPYRGKINEPKFARVVSEFVAGLRGEDLESLARATTRNARKLFGI